MQTSGVIYNYRSSFVGPLDILGLSPSAAYSVRRLSGAYTGPCLNVRRDSDNTEMDIGFLPNGDINQAALVAFVGSGFQGYCTKWYDQSGNGNDATQVIAADQPLLVFGGSPVDMNGKQTLNMGLPFYHMDQNTLPISAPYTVNSVAGLDNDPTGYSELVSLGGNNFNGFLGVNNSGSNAMYFATFVGNGVAWNDTAANSPLFDLGFAANAATLSYIEQNSSTGLTPHVNGNIQNTKSGLNTVGVTGFTLGGVDDSLPGVQSWQGNCSELIFFNTALSNATLHTLEVNQGAYWGITIT